MGLYWLYVATLRREHWSRSTLFSILSDVLDIHNNDYLHILALSDSIRA